MLFQTVLPHYSIWSPNKNQPFIISPRIWTPCCGHAHRPSCSPREGRRSAGRPDHRARHDGGGEARARSIKMRSYGVVRYALCAPRCLPGRLLAATSPTRKQQQPQARACAPPGSLPCSSGTRLPAPFTARRSRRDGRPWLPWITMASMKGCVGSRV
jgi:hypothetical protein